MLAIALTIALALTACAPRAALERAVLGRDVIRDADLAYGSDARQRVDVYRPRDRARAAPVLLVVYGGRWKYGAKRDYLLLADRLARRGWIVVLADYRHYPDVIFPAFVEDVAHAVRWTADHASAYGGDTSRLLVLGHSSGAHTVALLALDEHYLRDAGVAPGAVRGFVSLAGPVDTTWTARDVQRIMGPREGWRATWPATFIDGTEPPLLLLHGTRDDVVSAGNSVRLAERIRARGGCARARLYRGLDHVEIMVALAFPRRGDATVADDVAAFVRDPVATTCPERAALAR